MEWSRSCRQGAELAGRSICRAREGALHRRPGGGRECGGNEAGDHGQHRLPKARVIGNGARDIHSGIEKAVSGFRKAARCSSASTTTRARARRGADRARVAVGRSHTAVVGSAGRQSAPSVSARWSRAPGSGERSAMAHSAEPDAGAALSSSGKEARAAQARMRRRWRRGGTTDSGIETAASTFGLATRWSSAPARSPCRGGRARATAGDHPLSVSDAVTAGIAVTAIAIAHGRRARSLATGRGHDSVRSDDASSSNRGRLVAVALGRYRQREARAVHARAAAASVDGAEHRDGAQHRDGRDVEVAAGTLAVSSASGAGAERRAVMRERRRGEKCVEPIVAAATTGSSRRGERRLTR